MNIDQNGFQNYLYRLREYRNSYIMQRWQKCFNKFEVCDLLSQCADYSDKDPELCKGTTKAQ